MNVRAPWRGWDDIQDARCTTPSLTSIAPDEEALAAAAVDALLARPGAEPRPAGIAYRLAVRERSLDA